MSTRQGRRSCAEMCGAVYLFRRIMPVFQGGGVGMSKGTRGGVPRGMPAELAGG